MDGRFAEPELEASYRAFAWPTVRLQTALTLGGLSLGLLAAFFLIDLRYAAGTPVAGPLIAFRLAAALAGLAGAAWLLGARPDSERIEGRLVAPVWLALFLVSALIAAWSYPVLETTPEGLWGLLIFTSFWMSILTIVVGYGLSPYPWAVLAFSIGMAAGYVALALAFGENAANAPRAQAIVTVMAAAFAWIMAIVTNLRARRLYHVTRLYEQASRDAEASRALYAFLLGAAVHDVKQPLFAMKLNADLIAAKAAAGEIEAVARHAERQGAMAAGVNRLMSSIMALTGEAEIDAPPGPVEANRLFEDVVQTWGGPAEARGVRLRVVASRARLRLHRGAANHILGNAVSNALEHGGGRRVVIGVRRTGAGYALEVHDDGGGMPGAPAVFASVADVLDHAPESRSGSGLGLGIMFRLAEREGLPLTVRSAPGRGVSVRLFCERG